MLRKSLSAHNANSNAYTHGDGDTYRYSDSYAYGNCDGNSDTYCYSDSYAYGNCDGNPDLDADANTVSDTYTLSVRQAGHHLFHVCILKHSHLRRGW
jgi:hypothetical protein